VLSTEDFAQAVKSVPLVSIDLLVQNKAGQYLIGERLNKPAQFSWFVPGGRILKDELFDTAFGRLCTKELGLFIPLSAAQFYGVYQHFFQDAFVDDLVTTHYLVIAYQVLLAETIGTLPTQEHSNYRWCTRHEILDDPTVHDNVKAYFSQKSAVIFQHNVDPSPS